MAATFNVICDIGGSDGSPGSSPVLDALGPPNLIFKRADNVTVDSVLPNIRVAGQTKYSRWRSIYLKCTGAPTLQVNNVRFYGDGAAGFGTGRTLSVGLQFPTHTLLLTTGYEVAGTDDEELVAGHGGITTKGDAFSYTSAAPLTGPSITETGNLINAINETTDYLLLQLAIIDTSATGTLDNKTLTFLYDEI